MKLISFFSSLLLSTAVCLAIYIIPSKNELKIKKLSMEVREKYKERLPKLVEPKFQKVFGTRPRDKEIELQILPGGHTT